MAVSLEPEGDSVYAACKAGLTTLSNILAKEFGELGTVILYLQLSWRQLDGEAAPPHLEPILFGAGIGLVLAVVSVQALSSEGLVLSIPYPLIVTLLLLAAVAGVDAAIAPARRASPLTRHSVQSIADMKTHAARLPQLLQPQNKTEFKQFYKWLFDLLREDEKKRTIRKCLVAR